MSSVRKLAFNFLDNRQFLQGIEFRLGLGLVLGLTLIWAMPSFAKSKTVRKVQEVNFSEMNMKGTIRNPDGAYLVQKKGIKFMPLHDVKKDMDAKIRDAVNYL